MVSSQSSDRLIYWTIGYWYLCRKYGDENVIEPRGQELIDRYKKNYNIPDETEITENMILRHWELEKSLANELLNSIPENRSEVFERCYEKLYKELWWLNKFIGKSNKLIPSKYYRNWIELIGKPPKNIYEIGSGKADLITYLASCGFKCKGTEITSERGKKFAPESLNLSWGNSDGIHLEKFEVPGSYDVVISDNVIEHIHPDDIYEHFKNVYSILSIGGRYIFVTPHVHMGPSDVSSVFKCNKPIGMHLKEYTYRELKDSLEKAGFENVYAVFNIPTKITQLYGIYIKPKGSSTYLAYSCAIEKLISLLPYQSLKRKANFFFFIPNIFIIAKKK